MSHELKILVDKLIVSTCDTDMSGFPPHVEKKGGMVCLSSSYGLEAWSSSVNPYMEKDSWDSSAKFDTGLPLNYHPFVVEHEFDVPLSLT